MAWTERYLDAASSGGDGTTSATSGANAAWATVAAAISGVGAGPASAPTRINWKVGTYAQTSNYVAFNTAGATNFPVWWRGYKASPGDQDANNLAVAGTDIPTCTFTTGSANISGAHQIYSNIDFTGAQVTASRGMLNMNGGNCSFYGVRSTNTAANANGAALYLGLAGNNFIRCHFNATSSSPIVNGTTQSNQFFKACHFTGGNGGIVSTTATNILLADCIFDAIGGDVVSLSTGTVQARGCSIYNPTGNGFVWSGTPSAQCTIDSCLFEAVIQASKYMVNNASGTNTNLIRIIAPVYYNCNTYNGLGDSPQWYDGGVLASSPFTNASGHDFSLAAVAKALGFPGTFETISAYQGYLDPGAVQRIEPAGGSILINPGLSGGLR